MTEQEKRESVIKEFKDNYRPYSPGYAHVLVRNWAIRDAIDLLKAQEPRVMTLEEVEHLTYGSPYIIETNLPKEEPRLMYGLFSHLGLQGNFSFAFTDGRGYLFDVDYGKRWRCWTSSPTDEQREATPWQ